MSQVTIRPVKVAGVKKRPPAVDFELVGPAELDGGPGGWLFTDRPRRRPAAEWAGSPGLTVVLPLLLDRLAARASIEPELALVWSWGYPVPGTDEPPVLELVGRLPVPATSRWVLGGIDWGEHLRRGAADTDRVQQELALTLMEYSAANVKLSPARRARSRAGR